MCAVSSSLPEVAVAANDKKGHESGDETNVKARSRVTITVPPKLFAVCMVSSRPVSGIIITGPCVAASHSERPGASKGTRPRAVKAWLHRHVATRDREALPPAEVPGTRACGKHNMLT